MRWLTDFYDFRYKWIATAATGIHHTKAWLSQLAIFKNEIWTWRHFRRTICNKFCFKLGKMSQKRIEFLRLHLEHLAWIEHLLLSGIRDSRKAGRLWGMMRGVRGVRKSIHQSWLWFWLFPKLRRCRYERIVTGSKAWTIGRLRNCVGAHLGKIVCDKDRVVDWCIVLLEMPLTQFQECWPIPTESLPELP